MCVWIKQYEAIKYQIITFKIEFFLTCFIHIEQFLHDLYLIDQKSVCFRNLQHLSHFQSPEIAAHFYFR